VTRVILQYASGGSNANAGGTNVPTTAITDDGRGSTTNAGQTISTNTTSTTMTFAGTVDLTGVGGNNTGDVIHVQTRSGDRHLFEIATYTGGVSTCTGLVTVNATDGTGESGLSWAIGGIRLNLMYDTTQKDPEDAVSGWEFELGTQTYANVDACDMRSAVGDLTDGPVVIRAASGASPTITWTADSDGIALAGSNNHLHLQGLTLSNTNSTWVGTRALDITSGTGTIIVEDCTIVSSGACIYSNSSCYVILKGCDISSRNGSNGDVGVLGRSRSNFHVTDCDIHDCYKEGLSLQSATGLAGNTVIGNRIYDNGDSGTYPGLDVAVNATNNNTVIKNNACRGNTGAGILWSGTWTNTNHVLACINNICTNNLRYGLEIADGTSDLEGTCWIDFNAYHNNTSGATLNLPAGQGANDVTLSGDPFTDAAGGDWSLDNVAGEGAACGPDQGPDPGGGPAAVVKDPIPSGGVIPAPR
jgi:hypothetical protein